MLQFSFRCCSLQTSPAQTRTDPAAAAAAAAPPAALTVIKPSVPCGYVPIFARCFSSCLAARVPGPHVKRTRRFVQRVGHAPRTPVFTGNERPTRRSRSARDRTPVGDASSSKRCASTSARSSQRHGTTSAQLRASVTAEPQTHEDWSAHFSEVVKYMFQQRTADWR